MALDTHHLALVAGGADEEYASLADLEVAFDGRVLPLHSSALALHSKVLRAMFASTERAQWASGVGAALRGHDAPSVRLFLSLNYPTDGRGCGHSDVARARAAVAAGCDLEGALRLADKLDAPMIRDACERFLLDNPSELAGGAARWLSLSAQFGLHRLHEFCAATLLHGLLTADVLPPPPGPGAASSSPADHDLDDLGEAELRLLLKGTLRAWRCARQRHLALEVKPVEVCAHFDRALGHRLQEATASAEKGSRGAENLVALVKTSVQTFKVYGPVAPVFAVAAEAAAGLLRGTESAASQSLVKSKCTAACDKASLLADEEVVN